MGYFYNDPRALLALSSDLFVQLSETHLYPVAGCQDHLKVFLFALLA